MRAWLLVVALLSCTHQRLARALTALPAPSSGILSLRGAGLVAVGPLAPPLALSLRARALDRAARFDLYVVDAAGRAALEAGGTPGPLLDAVLVR